LSYIYNMKLKRNRNGRFVPKTAEQFIQEVNLIHNFKFDYSKVVYKNAHTKVIIICPIHGEFLQLPSNHKHGNGCKKCGDDASRKCQALSPEQFIKRATNIHNNLYDYSKMQYKTINTKIEILCKKCNTLFKQTPAHHLEGRGCRKCNSRRGWTKTEWIRICNNKNATPILYIIRCFNESEQFIKIGITSTLTQIRFKNKSCLPYSYEILKEIKGSPDFVWDKEKELHKLYSFYSYKPLISFAGETECFSINILQLI
jgi:hypothetical protein